jgi:hypothetical protein
MQTKAAEKKVTDLFEGWRLFCWPTERRLATRLKDETGTKQAQP